MVAVLTVLLAAALLASSCTGGTLQHQYRSLPSDGWSRYDTLCFDIPPATTGGRYTTDIEIRTATPLPYRKLWMALEFSLDSIAHRDTVCVALQDGERDIVKKGMAIPLYSYSHNAPDLAEGQGGQLKVFHLMSRECLPHILDVGIRMRPR